MTNLIPLILLIIGGIILTIGDIAMKKWVLSNSWIVYLPGIIIWLIGLNFLAFSFKYKNIAAASVIFVLFNVITLALVSWFYFKEKLSGFEIAGMLLGIAAIIILEIGEN